MRYNIGDSVLVNGVIAGKLFRDTIGVIVGVNKEIESTSGYHYLVMFDKNEHHYGQVSLVLWDIDTPLFTIAEGAGYLYLRLKNPNGYFVKTNNLTSAAKPYDPKQEPWDEGDI